jgi:hypothetical protein
MVGQICLNTKMIPVCKGILESLFLNYHHKITLSDTSGMANFATLKKYNIQIV